MQIQPADTTTIVHLPSSRCGAYYQSMGEGGSSGSWPWASLRKAGMGGEELNRRHNLLLVLDVWRHLSLDENGFKQMNKL
jgi:hypothetical protein